MGFFQQVIALTNAIPHGNVLNYGKLAQLLDHPRAARAVGYALNGLPDGTPIPWHRVVGKTGKMGRISLLNTLAEDEQYERLQEEGIQFDENRQFILIHYLWQPTPPEVQAALASSKEN